MKSRLSSCQYYSMASPIGVLVVIINNKQDLDKSTHNWFEIRSVGSTKPREQIEENKGKNRLS